MNQNSKSASKTSRRVASLIVCGIGLVFAAHLALFLLYASISPLEVFYNSSQAAPVIRPFQSLAGAGIDDSTLAVRFLSAVLAALTFWLSYRLACRWSGDAPSGAALTLGLILFPPAIYAFALALPHALAALIFVAGLTLFEDAQQNRSLAWSVVAGIFCAMLPFIHGTGITLAAMILALVLVDRGLSREFALTAITAVIAAGLLFGLAVLNGPFVPHTLKSPRSLEELAPVIQAYAMLWVANAFSASAVLGSSSLRLALGPKGVERAVVLLTGSVLAAASLLVVPVSSEESLVIAFAPMLILGVLASLPLVMWIRLVMPKVQSIAVWIVLPVIMYSCFWVVLGPIDLNGFPYDQLNAESLFSNRQSPG